MQLKSLRRSLLTLTIGVLSAVSPPKIAAAYPVDCAILLCLAGGFPSSPECLYAKQTVIRRITPFPIEPPIQIWNCPMGLPFGLGGPLDSQTVGLDDPRFNFSRAMNVYQVEIRDKTDRKNGRRSCSRWARVYHGSYDQNNRFSWRPINRYDIPEEAGPVYLGSCRQYEKYMFLDWVDHEGNYAFEKVEY